MQVRTSAEPSNEVTLYEIPLCHIPSQRTGLGSDIASNIPRPPFFCFFFPSQSNYCFPTFHLERAYKIFPTQPVGKQVIRVIKEMAISMVEMRRNLATASPQETKRRPSLRIDTESQTPKDMSRSDPPSPPPGPPPSPARTGTFGFKRAE